MSAPRTFLARSGMSPTVTADGYIVYGERGPDIFATVRRRGLRVDWEITAGPTGEPYAWGRTWTQGGADVAAICAAHRPGIGKAVRNALYFCATCAIGEGQEHESWCHRPGVMGATS